MTPETEKPSLEHYEHAHPTKDDLEWADLAILDFSQYDSPEGFSQLATQACEAMRSIGFLYIVNYGYNQEQTDRIFDIGNSLFTKVGDQEKKAYEGKMKLDGSYQGYKLREYWHVDGGVRDQIEMYNMSRHTDQAKHPEVLRPFLPEISTFGKDNHTNVLHKLLRLLAAGLQLPKDYFVDMHDYDSPSECIVRFMKYYPRSKEDEEKSKGLWLKGHTDFGSLTILWSQPVAGLQILTPNGKWRWVKHIENALVINVGDALEFLTGGYYKATIHRVIQPPPDQHGATRLGAFYFARTNDNVRLSPAGCLEVSPVLQSVGVTERFREKGWAETEAPLMEEWRRARVAAYGQSDLKKGKEVGVEEELINGRVVKHYN